MSASRGTIARRKRQRDRGAVAVLSAWFVLLLAVFLGLSINVGRLMRTRQDLQHAADSAALAAAEALNGMDGSVAAAREAAHQFGGTYALTTSAHVDVDRTNDVKFAFWHARSEVCAPATSCDPCIWQSTCDCRNADGVQGAFVTTDTGAKACPSGFPFEVPPDPVADPFYVNAVKVEAHYSLPTVFDKLMGMDNVAMTSSGWAINRRAKVRCALPFAIPACRILDPLTHALTCPDTDSDGNPVHSLYFTGGTQNNNNLTRDEYAKLGIPVDEDSTTSLRAFGRVNIPGIDYKDTQEPTVIHAAGYLNFFTRDRTALIDSICPAEPDYPVGVAQSVRPIGDTQPYLEPVIDSMLGWAKQQDPEGGLVGPPHECKLGQKRVVPVLQTDLPDCDPTTWPPTGKAVVVGFVNIVVRKIRCVDGLHTITEATNNSATNPPESACASTPPATLSTCGYDSGGDFTFDDGVGRVDVDVYCDDPHGLGTGTAERRTSRLVR